ncbi:MAG: hypothetical protein HZB67_03080 [Candidatus Aenigmarchaeota archaeon]|nr:hypothetical protein [Candidatus Aenigmarchaeota archaeon]
MRCISRRGLSPLLSTVLLISISVLVASMLMSWSFSITKGQQKEISNTTSEALSCTSANADIKYVYLDFSSNRSRVYVYNSGLTDQKIVSAWLLNNKGESANLTNSTILPVLITRGSTVMIEFNMTGKINACINFSKVSVSTNCMQVDFDSAPKCV